MRRAYFSRQTLPFDKKPRRFQYVVHALCGRPRGGSHRKHAGCRTHPVGCWTVTRSQPLKSAGWHRLAGSLDFLPQAVCLGKVFFFG